MQSLTVQLLKQILSSGSGTCAVYFERPALKQRFNQYQELYREVHAVAASLLLPYVSLIRLLAILVETTDEVKAE
jgi:hypothetical protein